MPAPSPAPAAGPPPDNNRQTDTTGLPTFGDGTPIDFTDKANWFRLQEEGLARKYQNEMEQALRKQWDAAGGQVNWFNNLIPGGPPR